MQAGTLKPRISSHESRRSVLVQRSSRHRQIAPPHGQRDLQQTLEKNLHAWTRPLIVPHR